MPTRGRGRLGTPTARTRSATSAAATTLTVEELRERLGDHQKEIKITIPKSVLLGNTIEVVAQKLHVYATKGEIVGDWMIGFTPSGYRNYHHVDELWFIKGTRPFTDEELLRDGKRFLAEKKKADEAAKKKRKKQIDQYNLLAADLGVDPIVE